jgi:type III secretory pathway lipoprotein EscJ
MTFSIRNSSAGTSEEKLAQKLNVMVSDLNLDLEQVGKMVARVLPNLTFSRVMVVLESAQAEREKIVNQPRIDHNYRDWRNHDWEN